MKSNLLLNTENITKNRLKIDLTYCFFLLFIVFLFAACSKESDDGMVDDNQVEDIGFIIDSDTYKTPNAYLIFHTVVQYDSETMMDVLKVKNHFSFLFMDGKAIINDRDILYSVDTKQSSYHYFRDIGNVDLVDDINSIEITPGTYMQSPTSTSVRVEMSGIGEEFTESGVSYGNPVFAGINYLLSDEDVVSFRINSIDIDYDTMVGTLDCEYSLNSSFASSEISGNFRGSFNILVK